MKLSLYFNRAPRYEGVLGSGGIAPRVRDLEVSGSVTHRQLYPQKRATGTHWIGGSVGPRAGLDAVMKRKIPSPCRHSNPRSPSP
jgi:hypothetical protein